MHFPRSTGGAHRDGKGRTEINDVSALSGMRCSPVGNAESFVSRRQVVHVCHRRGSRPARGSPPSRRLSPPVAKEPTQRRTDPSGDH
ncbi:hypothetical protein E2C01_064654 [Portunus trituberculatus]|uniref:Uncharacterized protein n=1 Tax=Portunus trituberculatus TaxID=210409 RepID=A0A5B7HLE6_PORTR|nr:hypothetical protein [Portunus trituberculatus]